MHTWLSLAAILFFGLTVAAAPATQASSDTPLDQWIGIVDGQIIYHEFPSAPYPHPSRANGYTKKTGHDVMLYSVEDHYSDPTVGIFIPSTFKPTDTTNYIVHFHGWNHHVAVVFKEYNLPHELVMSKANAILIVPQLPRDAPDSGGGKLELDQDGLRNLLTDVTAFLQAQHKITSSTLGKVVITAHSGGFKTAGAVLHRGGLADHITDCILFDASYGSHEYFTEWVAASPSHRLVSFYTDHLAPENQTIMGLLGKANIKYIQLPESDLSAAALASRTPFFMHTNLAHDDVVAKHDFFSLTISTSALMHDAP